ncbi:hypothetical protein [Paenibacillus sp. P36]|uniref:hypothetical protein n=1 Tax=Paenibacillus sp. P36 TaxID=3342538 RepID=UPI0038B26DBD
MIISMNPKYDRIAGGSGTLTATAAAAGSAHYHPTNHKQKSDKQDKMTISLQAQNLFNRQNGKQSMMERLIEQKQNMMDRRNEYMSNALERGASPEAMKADLEQMDKQIQELDQQIRELQHKDLRKATGVDHDSEEENDFRKNESKQVVAPDQKHDSSLSLDSMKAVVSTNNELKQTKSMKMAQITLHREAKNWESDPARSAELKSKADDLNGRMIHASLAVNRDLAHVIVNRENKDESTPPLPLNDKYDGNNARASDTHSELLSDDRKQPAAEDEEENVG